MDECKPYIDYRLRNVLFREAVISFLGASDRNTVQDKFCSVCKAAGMDKDCESCPKDFKVIGQKGQDSIGQQKVIGNA